MKQPLKHGFEFILIGSILFVAVIGLSFIKDSSLRIGLIGAISLFYVIAGIWHHYEEKNLHRKQVLEHFAMGALLFVVLAALFR